MKLWLNSQRLEPIVSAKPNQRFFWSRLEKFWKVLLQQFVKPPELQVWQKRDRWGNIWWNAYDPLTGRSIRHIAEEQMRIWIEQRYR
jgi:hypothetical protein